MKKALIYGLSLALLLSLTACHKPQADQPTEPDPPQAVTTTQADISTPEPLVSPEPEPPEQAPAHPDQLSDTIPAAPDEVEDTEPPEETGPKKTAPAEQAEQPPEATPLTTEPVVQQPSGGSTQGKPSGQTQQQQQTQQTPQGGSISLKDAAEQQGVQVTEQNTGKVWDQAFYDSLNPQQQAAYKNADDSTRIQMKDIIEVNRQLDQQGYEGNGDLTQEQVRETWGNIIVN